MKMYLTLNLYHFLAEVHKQSSNKKLTEQLNNKQVYKLDITH